METLCINQVSGGWGRYTLHQHGYWKRPEAFGFGYIYNKGWHGLFSLQVWRSADHIKRCSNKQILPCHDWVLFFGWNWINERVKKGVKNWKRALEFWLYILRHTWIVYFAPYMQSQRGYIATCFWVFQHFAKSLQISFPPRKYYTRVFTMHPQIPWYHNYQPLLVDKYYHFCISHEIILESLFVGIENVASAFL